MTVWTKACALSLGLGLLGAQAFRPERQNAPHSLEDGIEAHVRVPVEVRRLLRRSCYDCHSEEVRWPFWSGVAPASWLIADDVRKARHAMDFSLWNTARGDENLEGLCELAMTGEMPPRRYSLVHRGTKLSREEATILCAWALRPGA